MDFTNALPQTADSRAPVYEKVTGEETPLQFMTFILGEEEYGIDIMAVREIKGVLSREWLEIGWRSLRVAQPS